MLVPTGRGSPEQLLGCGPVLAFGEIMRCPGVRRGGGRTPRLEVEVCVLVGGAGVEGDRVGARSMVKARTGAMVATLTVLLSSVDLAVNRATRSRLSTTSAATCSGRVASGSSTTSKSQVWKACSLSRIPTNCSKSSVIGPIADENRSRSSGVMASSRAVPWGSWRSTYPARSGRSRRGVRAGEKVPEPALGDHGTGAVLEWVDVDAGPPDSDQVVAHGTLLISAVSSGCGVSGGSVRRP